MRGLLLIALVLFQALPPAAGLEVEVRAGLVTIRAHRTPLNRILDKLAQQTGMKVSYESSPPTQPVTATLERMPPRDAVVRLMEGMGVSYVFRTDVSGQRVETLIVSDGGTPSGTHVATAGQSPQEGMEFPTEIIDDPAEYEEAPPEIGQAMPEIPPALPGMPAPDLAMPGRVMPPGATGFPNAQNPVPNYPNPNYPGAPNVPGPISYPN